MKGGGGLRDKLDEFFWGVSRLSPPSHELAITNPALSEFEPSCFSPKVARRLLQSCICTYGLNTYDLCAIHESTEAYNCTGHTWIVPNLFFSMYSERETPAPCFCAKCIDYSACH